MAINEEKISDLVCEEIQKSDIWKELKGNRDFEKRVKELASDVVTELFRVLWQHNAMFKNLAR